MRSVLVAQLLADLGITKTHSRPYVSDDNPFSESQFRTLKYRPEFPERFGSIQDARSFCRPFFDWYNNEHRHSGIALYTPHSLHYGLAPQLNDARRQTSDRRLQRTSRTLRGKPPAPPALPEAVWINPPKLPGGSPDSDPELH